MKMNSLFILAFLSVFIANALSLQQFDKIDISKLMDESQQINNFIYSYTTIKIKSNIYYPVYVSKVTPITKTCIVFGSGIIPGQTSLISLFYDFGPLIVGDSSQFYKFVNNEQFTWANQCNLLFIDPIEDVGFTRSTTKSYSRSDNSATSNAYDLILSLKENFEELQNQEMYFIGIGYGAKLSTQVLNKIMTESTDTVKASFKGMFLGNPIIIEWVTSQDETYNELQKAQIKFLYEQSMLGDSIVKSLLKCEYFPDSPTCQWGQTQLNNQIYNVPFNFWNVYSDCEIFEEGVQHVPQCLNMDEIEQKIFKDQLFIPNAPETLWLQNCMNKYLIYSQNNESALALYNSILKNQRIYIFNGDTNAVVPFHLTEEFIYDILQSIAQGDNKRLEIQQSQTALSYQPIEDPEIQALVGVQVAGFKTTYKIEDNFSKYGEVTYATIRKSGFFPARWTQLQAESLLKDFFGQSQEVIQKHNIKVKISGH